MLHMPVILGIRHSNGKSYYMYEPYRNHVGTCRNHIGTCSNHIGTMYEPCMNRSRSEPVEIFHFCNAKSPISNTGSYLFKIYSNLNQIYSIKETIWFIHGSYMVPTCSYMVPIWFIHVVRFPIAVTDPKDHRKFYMSW